MIRIALLEIAGGDPAFISAIGTAPEQFAEELIFNPEVQAQYAPDSISKFLTSSDEPLPIEGEMEYMLGIPPMPINVTDSTLRRLYMEARQQKYKYKLMKLLGFCSPEDLNIKNGTELRKHLSKFNQISKRDQVTKTVVGILLGEASFRFHFITNYPFKNKGELEHTTMPYGRDLC